MREGKGGLKEKGSLLTLILSLKREVLSERGMGGGGDLLEDLWYVHTYCYVV